MRSTIALEDVASKLQVSVSTVSRALRGVPGIHPATRQKVMAEALRLGYVPQRRAGTREERPAKARQILVLSAGSSTPGGYLHGLSGAASEAGVTLQMHHLPLEKCKTLLRAEALPPSLRDKSCDGVILIYHWPSEIVAALSESFPVVSILHDYPGSAIDVVGIDSFGGMTRIVRNLAALGHRRIGFYGLMPEITWARDRFGAFAEAMIAEGLILDMKQVVSIKHVPNDPHPFEAQKHAASRVEAGVKSGVRAWVAADDFLGYRLGEALVQAGLRIPRDVSIAGFHRHDYLHASSVPTLTSTEIDNENIGRLALRQMLQRIDGDKGPPLILRAPANFVAGESCAAAS